ncbi:MAG: hypothetical protein IPH44_25545 [Myxococcales bacterium]|nr:hypothetical protein [Myxococcales bacterium]MBK7191769.1 hypothetical protein [Myxococcales bacterium]
MGRTSMVCALAVLASACYAEVGAGYFPAVKTHTVAETTVDADTSGLGLSVKVGFYLDVPLRWIRSAIGVGLVPAGTGPRAVLPTDGDNVGDHADELRVDVGVPWFWRRLQARATFATSTVTYTKVKRGAADEYIDMDAEGGGWFLGGSLSYVHRGSTLIGSLGVERRHMEMAPTGDPGLREVDYRATGVGVRFMIAWTPSGRFMQYYTPSDIRQSAVGANAGCYYRSSCDVDGHCTSSYYCP